jgi:hypothetical protein
MVIFKIANHHSPITNFSIFSASASSIGSNSERRLRSAFYNSYDIHDAALKGLEYEGH